MKVCNPFSISGFRYRLVTGTSSIRVIIRDIAPLLAGLGQDLPFSERGNLPFERLQYFGT